MASEPMAPGRYAASQISDHKRRNVPVRRRSERPLQDLASQIATLKEIKQVQLQILELQASLRKAGESQP
jgi:acetolactate synthase regulatory subunit